MVKNIKTSDNPEFVNFSDRGKLNPLLKWLWDLLSMFSGEEISIPSDFHSQVAGVKKVLDSDLSGMVNSVLDFAVDCALVDYTVETSNANLTEKLNLWMKNINEELRGKIPTGVKALAKEYFRERWKGSSLILLRSTWEEVDGFWLPTRLWFIDGQNLLVKDNNGSRVIGEETYSIILDREKNKFQTLPHLTEEEIFVQKPYSSWSELYPTPFLIQRGIYRNLKMLELINKKGEKIVAKALEYLFAMKKGTENLALKGNIVYDEKDLKKVKDDFKAVVGNSKSELGVPAYVTNFDTEMEHLIPDYSKAINESLYSPIEKRILAGLGLIEIVEGTTSTRREGILNPKPFIAEVRQGIADFESILNDIMQTIIERNTDLHRKYFAADIKIYASPIKQFITDTIRDHLRSMYDRGCLSKQTYIETVGEDMEYEVETQRRKDEYVDGVEDLLYPPVITNQENAPDVRNMPGTKPSLPRNTDRLPKDKIPDKKQGLEKKNFKGSIEDVKPYSGSDKEFTDALEEFAKIYEEAPYKTNRDLPPAVKKYPAGAQTAFRTAFNNALELYKNETTAFKVAWTVLKNWMKKHKGN
jgi:cation transport regulator ChaB